MIRLVDNKIELHLEDSLLIQWASKRSLRNPRVDESEVEYYKLVSDAAIREDRMNVLTHGLGLLMSVVAFAVLAWKSIVTGDLFKIAACSVFAIGLILVYGSSTLYHSLYRTFLRKPLQMLDHLMIFILIAASFTPFMLVSLKGLIGYSLLALIWTLAIVGIICKSRTRENRPFFWTSYYLIMGWLGVLAVYPLSQAIARGPLIMLLLGGLSYTVGVIFFSWSTLRYNHGIWHMFVMGGSILHFVAIYTAMI